jgi:hypothetical protein
VNYGLLHIKKYGYISSDTNAEGRWLALNGHFLKNLHLLLLTYIRSRRRHDVWILQNRSLSKTVFCWRFTTTQSGPYRNWWQCLWRFTSLYGFRIPGFLVYLSLLKQQPPPPPPPPPVHLKTTCTITRSLLLRPNKALILAFTTPRKTWIKFKINETQ